MKDYIISRINCLRKAKKEMCQKKSPTGTNMVLLEINTRLSELESIAIKYDFLNECEVIL